MNENELRKFAGLKDQAILEESIASIAKSGAPILIEIIKIMRQDLNRAQVSAILEAVFLDGDFSPVEQKASLKFLTELGKRKRDFP